MLDLPEAGRPVSQTVAPRVRSDDQRWPRRSPVSCQVTPGECGCSFGGVSRTSRTMPAPTVSFESSSTRMNAPVVRLSS